MEFLYFLEKLRVPVLNEFMLAITTLGDETAFLVIGLIVFWCFSKRLGYYVMGVGFLGTLANQFLKITCRVPRPWVVDKNFTILEQAREAASGYSFPSGHTQTAVGTFGAIARCSSKVVVRVVCIVLAVLVALSRMYLGVHTPADVLVAAAMAVVFLFVLHPLMLGEKDHTIWVLYGLALLSIAYLAYMRFFPFKGGLDPHNLESAIKNAYTMVGCTFGLLVVYPLERKYIDFPEKAVWWAQLWKVVLGLAMVLAVKEGLSDALDAMFDGHMVARSVRYFLVVFVAGFIWPLSFRRFAKLGKKQPKRKRK